jgi:hypothetical protein
MKPNRYLFPAFLLCLVIGSWLLYRATPLVLRETEWTQIVLHNWQDAGFWNLHGKLARNVAGEGLPEHPQLYTGHRPACLYPAYVVKWLTGGSSGLPFHLLLSLAVGLAIWRLLGSGVLGITTALLAVFSPAFLHRVVTLDPLDLPVILGLPFMYGVCRILTWEKLTAGGISLAAILVAIYGSLNWTTILAFAITLAYLAVALRDKPKRVLLFMLIAGVAGAVVLAISIASKVADASAAGSGLSGWYNAYLFGPLGYDGKGETWRRALVRLLVVNGLTLLPLWLLLVAVAWRSLRQRVQGGWFLLQPVWPLLMAIPCILGMRNYFGQHPWMAGAVLLYAIVFSLKLLLERFPALHVQAEPERLAWVAPAALVLFGFVHSLLVLTCLAVNGADEEAVLELSLRNTDRHDLICYSTADDPWIAENAGRLGRLTDRQFKELSASSGAKFRLTAQAPAPGKTEWLARTRHEDSTLQRLVTKGLGWYRLHVSKRHAGDRFEAPPVLYLYKLP